MTMVITNIIGGIGNQMFQYAAGRSLALATNQKHVLDLSDFTKYRLHNGFELSRVFNINVEHADAVAMKGMLKWRGGVLVKKMLRQHQFAFLRGARFVVEPSFNYWTEFESLGGNCYLNGYWQSEQYFKLIEQTVRQDFTFRTPLTGRNADLAIEIARGRSISLHVRRGDYVSDAKTGQVMDVCSLDYYRDAINYVATRVTQPVFYIFSDDIEWAKQNLKLNFASVYIDHNRQTESYRDMQLMSLCQHQIMANSSFSWWGAWLNLNVDKIVVAPQCWFRNGYNTEDLIPRTWVQL